MPERPDLEYVVATLQREVAGETITDCVVRNPVVLRVAVAGDVGELLRGRTLAKVARRGHFVRFELDDEEQQQPELELVVSPMLAGVFDLVPASKRLTADAAVCLQLSSKRQLRYRDRKQMGKVYLIEAGDWSRVPGLREAEGLDMLDDAAFTCEAFRELARKRRDQVRVFLMDKSALDALGNAYADEVLWAARIHPKAWVRKLDDAQLDRLHDALVEVISNAVATIARRAPPLSQKLRDFLKVRGKAGQPCPRCSTTLRRARVRAYDAHFCPSCQPDQRDSGIVDWRKLPSGKK